MSSPSGGDGDVEVMSRPPRRMDSPVTISEPAAAAVALPQSSPAGAMGSKPDESRPTRSPSPDIRHCSICLQDLVNKSYSNTCCHEFCFACLLEWSKVKPECPLCKASFRSIYHNIRSNEDYDEYVVPTPVPHLSIRLTTSDRFSPEVIVTSRGSNNLGNHDYSIPEFRISGFRPSRSSRDVAHAIMRDRLRDPRVIRIFQYAESQGRSDSFDLTLQGPALPSDNPFHSDPATELFGASLEMVNASSSSGGAHFSGYQSRRRRYDRNQWVCPFDSALQPGTVFFPSVEYFQGHPSAIRRIGPWLHREMTVLLSLNRSRPQMAFIYDLIISLLSRYDIRSREFRELLVSYFGTKTKHFQHEFYHYVLSGMRMEEYDRVASYGNNQSHVLSTNFDDNPASREPQVVTLDSDEENNDNDNNMEIVLSGDDEPPHVPELEISDEWLDDMLAPFNGPLPRMPSPFSNSRAAASSLPAETETLNPDFRPRNDDDVEMDCTFDPEMPVLEPQVDLNNLSGSAGGSGTSRRRPRTERPIEVPAASTTSTASSRARASRTIGLLNSLREIYMNPDRHHNVTNNDARLPATAFHRDPADGRRSPYPQPSIFAPPPGSDSGSSSSVPRPLRSPDFPTLDYERRQRTHPYEIDYVVRTICEPRRDYVNGDMYRSRLRSYHGQRAGAEPRGSNLSSPLHHDHPYLTGGRSSCLHDSPTSPSTPTPIDLTTNNPSSASRGSNRNDSVIHLGGSEPGYRPGTPFDCNPVTNQPRDEGECEFLGVHPVVKKPPLAVITLSSDDEAEQGRRCKDETFDISASDPAERDTFMELFREPCDPILPVASPPLNVESFDPHVPTGSRYTPHNNHNTYCPLPDYSSPRASRWTSLGSRISAFSFPNPLAQPSPLSPAFLVIEPPSSSPTPTGTSSSSKKPKRTRAERDSRRRSVEQNGTNQRESEAEEAQEGRKKRKTVLKKKATKKSKSRSSSSDSSDSSETDFEPNSKVSKKKTVPKRKKSKKCRRRGSRSTSKSSSRKDKEKENEREMPPLTMSFPVIATASTSAMANAHPPKLKSVVVKVDKKAKKDKAKKSKRAKKVPKSRALVYTSSEDSSADEGTFPPPPTITLSLPKSQVDKDLKKIQKSVIASTSTSARSSVAIDTLPAVSPGQGVVDLRDTLNGRRSSRTRSGSATLPPQAASRRWESDDDERRPEDFESEALLSVGYEGNDNSDSSGSDTDDRSASNKAPVLWASHGRKRLTTESSMNNFMSRDSSALFSVTSAPSEPDRLSPVQLIDEDVLISHSPLAMDRFVRNPLARTSGRNANVVSPEVIRFTPPPRNPHQHHHRLDVDISYPERRAEGDEDLLDLTVTVTRSGSSSPASSPVPPVQFWW